MTTVVLAIVLAVVLGAFGIAKIGGIPAMRKAARHLGFSVGQYRVIGALELAGAIAMFVPRLTGLAATCFVALMIGAVIATLAIGGGAMAAIPATVGVVAAVVAWGRRDSTRRLIAQVRR